MDPDARKKTLRRSRQPLSRYGQRAAVEGSAPSSPVVIKDMEYDDPVRLQQTTVLDEFVGQY